MITLIIPTRNRSYLLERVAPSYYQQSLVTEIIFVDDAGNDDTQKEVDRISSVYPSVTTKYIRNSLKLGASSSRNIGVAEASNEFVLFCDDDESLETGYAEICLQKLRKYNAGAVSGRRIYLNESETPAQALVRFGNGLRFTSPFRRLICEYVNGARFKGDISLPITNAIILTRVDLLRQYPFDSAYVHGNGYREESDFQMNLYVNGYSIYVTSECHSFHLPIKHVPSGGQRTSKIRRIFWSIYYTRYFFSKYYTRYARLQRLRSPCWFALLVFSIFAVYRELFRNPLYKIIKSVLRVRGKLN